MNQYIILFIISGFIFFWLTLLTLLFVRLKKHYQQLLGKNNKANLEKLLDQILITQKRNTQETAAVKNYLKIIENNANFHLQKIGFLRFNPFDDTGGDQSFVFTLLDNKHNGIVFTFLHNRETTRVYAKQIEKGGSKNFTLSKEEESVIAQAISSGL